MDTNCPFRCPPAGSDIIINSDQSANITAVPSISLLSLSVSGNCNFESPTTATSTITITGTFTIAAGKTFSTGASSEEMNFTLSSSAIAAINGTFNFVSGKTNRLFTNNGDLTIASAGLVKDPGGTANSDFTLGAGAALRIGSPYGISTGTTQDATIGNIQVTGTRTYTAGANYIYNGSATQVTGNGLTQNTPANLTISNSAGVALSAATAISGNLTISNGATLNTSTSNYQLTLGGNFNNNGGTFTPGTGIVIFNGATQTLSGSTSTTFNNLTISSSTSTTLGVNTSVAGNLSITTGDFFDLSSFSCNRTIAGGTLTVAGTLLVGGTSNFPTNFNTFTNTGGTVNYDNAGAQNVTAKAYNNLIFSGSGAKSIVTGTSVTGNLSITGATASVGAGLNISVGTLTLGGSGVINGTWGSSTATSATYHNDTYFAATTGYVTVATSTCVAPAAPTGTGASRCGTGTVVISATPGAGETIDWYAASTGGTILTGGTGTTSFTTPSISVTTTYYSQSRNTTTGCISATRTAVIATVNTIAPAQPSTITGIATPCLGSSQTYSVTNVAGVSYAWTFPSGWSQTAGGTTNSVTVTVGSGTGNIQVTPSNSCGNGTARTLAVTESPSPVITCPSNVSTSTNPVTSLITAYSFNETTGTTAYDAVGTKNGTFMVSPSWSSGQFGNAVLLDGGSTTGDYVDLPDGIVAGLTNFSISTWVYLNNQTDTWSRIFDFGTSTTNYMFITPRNGTTNAVRFAIRTNATAEQVISGTSFITSLAWHHIVVTLQGGTGTLYVDGVAVGTNAAMTLTPNNLGNTTLNYIGESQFTGDNTLAGKVDEFRIYNTALSLNDVKTLYNTTSCGVFANLGTATYTGGCGSVTVTNNAPSPVPAGTTTVTWTATDASSNSSTCQQTVTVTNNSSPTITTQPIAPAAVCAGSGTQTIGVVATGASLKYQWQVNTGSSWTNVSNGGYYSGAEYRTLTITNPIASMNGYQYQVVVTSSSPCGGSATSNPVILPVTAIPAAPVANTATNVTSTGFDANWSIASGATGYYLDVSVSNTFASFVSGYNNLNVLNVLTYPVTVPGIGTYYYRLRAYNGSCISGNSNVITLTTVAGNSITAGTVSAPPFCVGTSTSAAGTIAYTSTGTYSSATFTALISDAAGSFPPVPVSIGTATGITGTNPSGTINITIPAGTVSGAGYKIRIDCATPAVTGTASSAFTIVNGVSNVTSPSAAAGSSVATLSWTNPVNCFDEILIVAKAGSSVSGVPSGNGSAYTGNLAYGSGTAFSGGGFVVYKGLASPQTITSLVNGTQYFFKFFTRKGTDWSSGIETNATPSGIECLYGDATNSGLPVFTPCVNMPSNVTDVSTSFSAHQYFVMDVVKGLTYQVYTCNTTNPAQALKISVYEESVPGGPALFASASNSGNPCAPSQANNVYLSFTSPLSGQVRILINRSLDCAATTPGGLTVKVNVSGGSNTQDDQAAAGTDSWIGHFYDGTNAAIPHTGAFSNYLGYYTKTENFSEIFGIQNSDTYCYGPIYSNGVNRVSVKTVTYALRYRMNSTRHGLYVADISSDDGARLVVDANLIYDHWDVHDNNTNTGILMNLTGTSNLGLDWYENTIDNSVTFLLNNTPVLANTLSANTTQAVCLGNSGVVISGDIYGALPPGITLVGSGYQWTYSTTPGGARTNIAGATAATFTPNSTVAPFTTAGTYYIYRNASVSSTNNFPIPAYVATNESNAAILTVNPPPPPAPFARDASNLTPTGFSANWYASSGATGYYLDVSTSNTFSSFVPGYNNLDVLNVLTFPVTVPATGTYYYRIRAHNSSGVCSSVNSNVITVEVVPLVYIYRSLTSGNWNATGTWQVSSDGGASWGAATVTPTNADGTITIRNTHTVNVTASVTVDQLTVDNGGIININYSQTFTVADGPGTDLLNNGIITAIAATFASSAINVSGQVINNSNIVTQVFSYPPTTYAYSSLNINSGASLSCSPTSLVSGAGDFTLANGGSIEIGSADGISALGTNSGNVQTMHMRSFNTGANYAYIGSAAQSTGNGLPTTVNNLTINNNAPTPGVSLTSPAQVNGNLTLTSGRFIIGSNNLTLATTTLIGGSFSANTMIIADNTGKVIKNLDAIGSFTFPVGSTAHRVAYSPITINVSSGSFSSAHIDLNLHDVVHPLIPSDNYYLKRYFTVSTTGITGLTYGTSFVYDDLDINGNENLLNAALYAGSTWSYPTGSVSAAGNLVNITGLVTGGDLTAAGKLSVSIVSNPTIPTICQGSSIQLYAGSDGGKGPYTYLWTPGNLSSQSVTVNPASNTTYYVTVTDALNMTASNFVDITVNPVPTAYAGTDASITPGAAYHITDALTNGSPILWTSDGPGTLTNATTISPTYTSLVTESIPVTLTLSVGSSPCTVTDVMTILYPPTNATWTGLAYNRKWNTNGNWDVNAVPGSITDVIIPNGLFGNDPIVLTAAACKNITLETNATLQVTDGASFTATGTFINNAGAAGLVVKSGGSLIQSTTSVPATVERDIAAADWGTWNDGWHFLSSPVASQAINSDGGFTTEGIDNDYDFYAWRELTNEWVNFKNTTFFSLINPGTDFVVGRGYMVAYQQPGTKLFSGNLNVGDVSKSGLTISSGVNHSWHLLGNPYSSALTWKTDWITSGIGTICNIWNESLRDYSPVSNFPIVLNGGIIPSLNGFMIEATADGASLTIPTSARTHSTIPWYKNASSMNMIKLTAWAEDRLSGKESYIVLDPMSTVNFDPDFDGHFIGGYGPKFYSLAGTDDLTVNTLPELEDGVEVPIVFEKNSASNFSIELDITNLIPDLVIYLEDKKTGIATELSKTPVYHFSSADGDDINRFLLHFKDATSVNDVAAGKDFSVYTDGNIINVLALQAISGQVKVYDMAGREIASVVIIPNQATRIDMHRQSGVYVVSVITNKGISNSKIVIK